MPAEAHSPGSEGVDTDSDNRILATGLRTEKTLALEECGSATMPAEACSLGSESFGTESDDNLTLSAEACSPGSDSTGLRTAEKLACSKDSDNGTLSNSCSPGSESLDTGSESNNHIRSLGKANYWRNHEPRERWGMFGAATHRDIGTEDQEIDS